MIFSHLTKKFWGKFKRAKSEQRLLVSIINPILPNIWSSNYANHSYLVKIGPYYSSMECHQCNVGTTVYTLHVLLCSKFTKIGFFFVCKAWIYITWYMVAPSVQQIPLCLNAGIKSEGYLVTSPLHTQSKIWKYVNSTKFGDILYNTLAWALGLPSIPSTPSLLLKNHSISSDFHSENSLGRICFYKYLMFKYIPFLSTYPIKICKILGCRNPSPVAS